MYIITYFQSALYQIASVAPYCSISIIKIEY